MKEGGGKGHKRIRLSCMGVGHGLKSCVLPGQEGGSVFPCTKQSERGQIPKEGRLVSVTVGIT